MSLLAQKAIEFPYTLTKADGLCDDFEFSQEDWSQHYFYTSPVFHIHGDAVKKLRFTVPETTSSDAGGGYPCFALAEFFIYDSKGKEVKLDASAFSTNAQEPKEGPMEYICDRHHNTFFHSLWSYKNEATGPHYIDVTLPTKMQDFAFGYISRYDKVAPAKIIIDDVYRIDEEQRRIDEERERRANHRDTLIVTSDELANGCEWTVSVTLRSSDDYVRFTALQMEMELPAEVSRDDMKVTLEKNFDRLAAHDVMAGPIGDNKYRLIIYSTVNDTIDGITGELFKIHLTSPQLVPEGKYTIPISNIRLTAVEREEWPLNDTHFTINSSDPSAPIQYEVTQSDAIEHGSIYISKKKAKAGDTVAITALADAGYQFARWLVDDIELANPSAKSTKFVMPGHSVVVNAEFVPLGQGISPVHADEGALHDSNSPFFDLQGRPVSHPQQGVLYIKDGKKILIK